MSSGHQTPDQPGPGSESDTAEPPAADGIVHASTVYTPGFADRVGRRVSPTATDPCELAADPATGIRLFESKSARLMAILFDGKPSQPVIDRMIQAGYRWIDDYSIWLHPIPPESAHTTRIDAERLYQEVRNLARQERNAGPSETNEMPIRRQNAASTRPDEVAP